MRSTNSKRRVENKAEGGRTEAGSWNQPLESRGTNCGKGTLIDQRCQQ